MIIKNEATPGMRRIIVTFFDNDGVRKTGLTFGHAAGEVKTNYGGSSWVEAAADAVEIGLGDYYVTLSQAETNHDVNLVGVALIKSGYRTQSAYEDLIAADLSGGDAILEGSATRDDILRAIVSAVLGKVTDFRTGTYAFKSLDGSKTRYTITADESGRTASTAGDLTP